MTVPQAIPAASSRLATRVVVGALLIGAAVSAVRAGGLWFTALVTLAVLLMFAEWTLMHRIGRGWRLAGLAILAVSCTAATLGWAGYAVAGLAATAGMLALIARRDLAQRAFWLAAGLLYCGLPGIALIWMRRSPHGFELTLWTLAIVWATDIFAFFAGRSIGGAKLAPSISPNKTWAGLGGGIVGAAIASAIAAVWLNAPTATIVLAALAAAILAIIAQCGDLFESWLKRRIGIKDSGTLLPGHGGVMDRLDGLVPVAAVVALGAVVMGSAR